MNNNKIKIVLLIVIIGLSIAKSQENSGLFKLLTDERSLIDMRNVHIDFLGYILSYPLVEEVPDVLRGPQLKTPGDYYRHPRGADATELKAADIKEIENTLRGLISDQYYDSYVLENLAGYEYNLLNGKIARREYYVKYSRGDTIFVISGLLGKFLSFYRAVPGEFRLSIDKLKAVASRLSPAVEFDDNDSLIEKENEYIYFIEHMDREAKSRLRNYQVVENWQEDDKDRDNPIGKYYNLIEITRFLDEEAIP